MHVVDITPIGWLHSAACMIALFAGALNLTAAKGTPQHRAVGRLYVWSTIVLNLSALTIYRFDTTRFKPFKAGPHVFGLFHWFAVATLIFVLIGRYAAARQDRAPWAYVHPIAMILSYYLLVGGAINEAFVRIDALHTLAAHSAGSLSHAMGAPIIRLAHTAAMAAAFMLILYFVAKVVLYRRTARA
jgi:uncharacterized membrane protein